MTSRIRGFTPIPGHIVTGVVDYIGNGLDPLALSRSELNSYIAKKHPTCVLTGWELDYVYNTWQQIGELCASADHVLAKPELIEGWRPDFVRFSKSKAAIYKIRLMHQEVYDNPKNWVDYDAYHTLPPDKRPPQNMGRAAEAMMAQMPNLVAVKAITLVFVVSDKDWTKEPKGRVLIELRR